MRFDGPRIYSYQTVIACFHAALTDPLRAVLINSNKFSMTTSSKHMPQVHRALYGLSLQQFTVPICMPNRDADHAVNRDYLRAQYLEWGAKLKRKTDDPSEGYYEDLRDKGRQLIDYCRAFGLDTPSMDVAADEQCVKDFRAARAVRLANDPRREAKRLARAAARERAEARKQAMREEQRRIDALEASERLALWQSGADVRLHYGDTPMGNGALLRLRGHLIETSQGAQVSTIEARKFIPMIRDCIARSEGCNYENNGAAPMVGNFTVRQIHRNGDVRIGCHFIQWEETAKIAAQLGV